MGRFLRFVSFEDDFLEKCGDTGMEAEAVGSKRILECPDEAKSPQRILVRSLLKSRNKLRAKYRELRADCKRWRNQSAAVEKSRTAWRQRALTGEATLRHEQAERAALKAQLQELREQSAAREAESAALRAQLTVPEGAEKKGR
jgi:chromosome segregation ATPase